MASPIYGTGNANMMQLAAGQARGLAEAERIRRLQQQQDFENTYRVLGAMDQREERGLARSDRNQWNTYNALMNARRQDTDFDFNVWDRLQKVDSMNQALDRDAWSRGMEERRLTNAEGSDQWHEEVARGNMAISGLRAAMPRGGGQKPLSVLDSQRIGDLEAIVYNPESSDIERSSAINTLQRLNQPVYGGPMGVESQKMGTLARAVEAIKGFSPLGLVGVGEGNLENLAQTVTGYTGEGLGTERQQLQDQIKSIMEHERRLRAAGRPLPQQVYDALISAKERLKALEGEQSFKHGMNYGVYDFLGGAMDKIGF